MAYTIKTWCTFVPQIPFPPKQLFSPEVKICKGGGRQFFVPKYGWGEPWSPSTMCWIYSPSLPMTTWRLKRYTSCFNPVTDSFQDSNFLTAFGWLLQYVQMTQNVSFLAVCMFYAPAWGAAILFFLGHMTAQIRLTRTGAYLWNHHQTKHLFTLLMSENPFALRLYPTDMTNVFHGT